MWPRDPHAVVAHFVGGGVPYFDIIDVLADPTVATTPEFVTFSRNTTCLDVPVSLIGEPPSHTSIDVRHAVAIAVCAWQKADPNVRCAFAQGRAIVGLPLYVSLSLKTRVCHEVPYTLAIAMRALRPDIQQFVAAAAFRMVTLAPNHDKINEFFEACLKKPLAFALHSEAWRSVRTAFINLSCSGKVVAAAKKATLQVDTAFVATTRRDLILIVLVVIFGKGASADLGPSLNAIVDRFPWIRSGDVAPLPWWMTQRTTQR